MNSIMHADAYYNSIHFVAHGVPYSDAITSVYGHYALIYAPIINFMHAVTGVDLYHAFSVCTAAFCAFSYFLFAYTVSILLKNKYVWLLALMALLYLPLVRINPFYQLRPHRILCLALFCCLFALDYKHKDTEKRLTVLGCFICAFALIWNPESGVIGTAAWVVMRAYLQLLRRADARTTVKRVIFYIICAVISAAAAWLCLNIYNLAAGGGIIGLRGFLFPLFSKTYIIDNLRTPIAWGIHYWIFELLLCFGFVAFAIARLFRKNTRLSKKGRLTGAMLGVAILTIGLFSYYFNRFSAGNQTIAYNGIVILLAVLCESCMPATARMLQYIRKMKSIRAGKQNARLWACFGLRGGFGLFAILVLFSISMATFMQAAPNYVKLQAVFKNDESLIAFADEIKNATPEDTKLMGSASAALYALMGRDAVIYTTDFSDVFATEDSIEFVLDALENSQDESVLISQFSLAKLNVKNQEAVDNFKNTHELAAEFWAGEYDEVFDENTPIYGDILNYYVPKESGS